MAFVLGSLTDSCGGQLGTSNCSSRRCSPTTNLHWLLIMLFRLMSRCGLRVIFRAVGSAQICTRSVLIWVLVHWLIAVVGNVSTICAWQPSVRLIGEHHSRDFRRLVRKILYFVHGNERHTIMSRSGTEAPVSVGHIVR